jgi:hypothetical protein
LPGFGSANEVKGTRQRCAGLARVERQNGLDRLRTLVTGFWIGLPLLPLIVVMIPQAMRSTIRAPSCLRITQASYLG